MTLVISAVPFILLLLSAVVLVVWQTVPKEKPDPRRDPHVHPQPIPELSRRQIEEAAMREWERRFAMSEIQREGYGYDTD